MSNSVVVCRLTVEWAILGFGGHQFPVDVIEAIRQTPQVYKWVIDNVIEKMSAQFAEAGLGDNILQELAQTWEQKIINMHVATFPRPAPEDYGYEGANGAFGAGAGGAAGYYQEDGTFAAAQNLTAMASGAYNPRISQVDGAGDDVEEQRGAGQSVPLTRQQIDEEIMRKWAEKQAASSSRRSKKGKGKAIAQVDGVDDDDDDDDDDDIAEPPANADEDIGSDLDDEDSEEEGGDVDNLILCQYEKVTRIKNKWKCTLKDGIVSVNGKDYLFNRANGDFEW
ncbi:transcription factor IIA subunit alpha [Borealophlyctis nickersoniae]|nr:transcription factor IIA subunit alpha [Borealophlyctis nickersoniae]